MIIFAMLLVCMASAEAVLVDKGGILDSTTRGKIAGFSNSGYDISVIIENYVDAPEEYAIKQYNKNEQDILLLFVIQNKSTVIVQPGEDILTEEQLQDIGRENDKQRLNIKNNQDINAYIRNIISALEIGLIGEASEGSFLFDLPTTTPATCALVKDGICDPECMGDPDCECGDGVCQVHENSVTCPEDCGEEKDIICGVIRDNICDPECAVRDIDCKVSVLTEWIMSSEDEDDPTFNIIVAILIASAIICGVIALLLLRSIKRQQL